MATNLATGKLVNGRRDRRTATNDRRWRVVTAASRLTGASDRGGASPPGRRVSGGGCVEHKELLAWWLECIHRTAVVWTVAQTPAPCDTGSNASVPAYLPHRAFWLARGQCIHLHHSEQTSHVILLLGSRQNYSRLAGPGIVHNMCCV